MKKRTVYNPCTVEIAPASPDGIAPMTRIPAMTLRGPYRSTRGPTIKRTRSVEQSEIMFELPKIDCLHIPHEITTLGLRTYLRSGELQV